MNDYVKLVEETLKKHKVMNHSILPLSGNVTDKNYTEYEYSYSKKNSELTDEELEAKIYYIKKFYGSSKGLTRNVGNMELSSIAHEIDKRLLERMKK